MTMLRPVNLKHQYPSGLRGLTTRTGGINDQFVLKRYQKKRKDQGYKSLKEVSPQFFVQHAQKLVKNRPVHMYEVLWIQSRNGRLRRPTLVNGHVMGAIS